MNLMKYFNINYFIENIKKSISILMFVCFMFLASNFIFMIANSYSNINVLGLEELSVISTIFMFILPITLSIILFGYVFKKKSVDFINSMPIDRKTLFITNSIFGSLLLILIIIINALMLFSLTNLFSNIYIPNGVFTDYILLFTISYIFMFTISNLAISLSGNVFTSIIVSTLILYLIPAIYFITTSLFFSQAEIGNIALFRTYSDNYTYPVKLITMFINSDINLFSYISILKMFILSILYFIIGICTFKKRKMEYCETSFKNYKIHQLVKILTMIPLLLLSSYLVINTLSLFTCFIMVVFIIFYIFVYDLITRKSITDITFNILTSLLTAIIIIAIVGMLNETTNNKENNITTNDINSIYINLNDFDFHIYIDDYVKFASREDINKILEYVKFSDYNNYNNYNNYDQNYMSKLMLSTNKGNFIAEVQIKDEDRSKLRDLVYSKYQKKIDNYYDKLFLSNIEDDKIRLDENNTKLLKKALKSKYDDYNLDGINLSSYMYIDHKLMNFNISSNINKELNESIIRFNNSKVFDIIKGNNYSVIWILNINKLGSDEYYNITDGNVINLFIKSLVSNYKDLDFSKDIYRAEIYLDDNYYSIYANLSDELKYLDNFEEGI